MKKIEIGSLIRVGPEDTILWENENGLNKLHLEDYEHGIVTAINEHRDEMNFHREFEVLLGKAVYFMVDSSDINNLGVMQ